MSVAPPRASASSTLLASSLGAACRSWPDRVAVTHRGMSLTYGQLWERVSALARSYRAMGVVPGDRVLCGLRNCPAHVVAVGAAWACGALHVGFDDDLTGAELCALAERTEPAAAVLHPRPHRADPLEPAAALARARPSTAVIVHEGPGTDRYRSLDELMAQSSTGADEPAEPPHGRDAPALMFLTSGTTGRPKGVLETLPSCWAKMQFFADAFAPGPDDVHLLYLPMTHVFGLRLALIALLRGGRLVLMDRFSPTEALRLATDEGVTVLPGMPTHLKLLLDRVDPTQPRLEALRWVISAAAGLPRPLAEGVYGRLGADILFVFGCSEGFTTLTTDRAEILAGSVGTSVFRGPPGTPPTGRVAIMAPGRTEPLPPGEVGEIVFEAAVPVRYWRDPDVATDGWYRTGDLGRIDPDGRLYVLGRLKELVNRGGLKVYPDEVEAVLARHPGLRDAAVVGTPDPVLGEATCACVVAHTEPIPSLEEVRAFLGTTLARHKLPDELCVVKSIPRTPIGKVERATLAALVAGQGVTVERLRPR